MALTIIASGEIHNNIVNDIETEQNFEYEGEEEG